MAHYKPQMLFKYIAAWDVHDKVDIYWKLDTRLNEMCDRPHYTIWFLFNPSASA